MCEAWRYMGLGSPRTKEPADYHGWGLKDAEGAHDEVVGNHDVPVLIQAPPPPPPAPVSTIIQRLNMLDAEVYILRSDMGEQKGVLDSMAHDFSRFTTWTVTSLSRMMVWSRVIELYL
ncbi:hypothetical protein Tco_1358419 [Tanacetum coccineum]